MGIIRNRAARVAALLAVGTLASTLGIQSAAAEGEAFLFANNRYVNAISIDNGDDDVVVYYGARRTPRSVKFGGWSIDLDTVAGRDSDYGALDFYATGTWKRPLVKVWEVATDESYESYRVTCEGATSTLQGRVKRVVIPRSCLALDNVAPTAVRASVVVYGTRVRPSGTTCWGVGAPRKGFTPWLEPGDAPERAVKGTNQRSVLRGC